MPKKRPTILDKASRRQRAPSSRPKVVTGLYGYSASGAFRAKRTPTPIDLVQSYRLATYACANINARAFAATPLRLYVTTAARQSKALCPTKKLSRRDLNRLTSPDSKISPYVSKALRTADHVEEVTEHPILDLFDRVNPWMDKFQLLELTQLYQEIVGTAFWTFAFGALDRPIEIWPLPSWMVYAQPDYTGTNVIEKYVFTGAGGQTELDPSQVLYFRTTSLFDPYTQGYSPLRASYDLAQIYDKRTDYEDSVLTNRARPDVMLESTDPLAGPTSPEEVARVNFEFRQNFGMAQAGGVFVPPGGYKPVPLTWSPRDMGEMAMDTQTLHGIARGFDVPIPLIDGSSANRANMDAALLQHAREGVLPRVRRSEECLNSNFVSRFSDRLFLAFDNPVPADEAGDREKHKTYFTLGVYSPNDIAAEIGIEPFEGGDERFIAAGLVPLSKALEVGQQIIPALESPNPDEEPDSTREPAESADGEAAAEVSDEPFAEGDDIESEGSASKGLKDSADHPLAHAILSEALHLIGDDAHSEYLDGSLSPSRRLHLLGAVSSIAQDWLRQEAERTAAEIDPERFPVPSKALFGKAAMAAKGFFNKARSYLREAIVAGTLAVLGPDPLSAPELHAMERATQNQLSYLDKFEHATISGPPNDHRNNVAGLPPAILAPNFISRAESYGSSVWGAAQSVKRAEAEVRGYVREWRELGAAEEHCEKCVENSVGAIGKQPLNTLPDIGSLTCLSNCRCHFEYDFGDEDEAPN